MHRTQVYLGARELAALDVAQRRTGASRGELIRRAVLVAYEPTGAARERSARGRFAGQGEGIWSADLIAERRAETRDDE